MTPDDFRGILTKGGTVLGTKRTPFKMMQIIEEDGTDKVKAVKSTYKNQYVESTVCLCYT